MLVSSESSPIQDFNYQPKLWLSRLSITFKAVCILLEFQLSDSVVTLKDINSFLSYNDFIRVLNFLPDSITKQSYYNRFGDRISDHTWGNWGSRTKCERIVFPFLSREKWSLGSPLPELGSSVKCRRDQPCWKTLVNHRSDKCPRTGPDEATVRPEVCGSGPP